MTADQMLRQLEADERFRARRASQEAALREHTERRVQAEQPLIAELARMGYRVNSVWDLVNTRATYASAIPVLIEHLQKPYSEEVLEGIARALAVPEARSAWGLLRRIYIGAGEAAPNGLKTALACALSAAANDDVLDDVGRLVRDRSHGPSRILFLQNLALSDRPDLKKVLEEAVDDPELTKEAQFQLRRVRQRRRRD